MPSTRSFKNEVYGHLARVTKAMAHPVRFELLDLLGQAPRTVEDLANQVGQSIANTSHHLQILRSSQLVRVHREGIYHRYSLADEEVRDVLFVLKRLGEHCVSEVGLAVENFFQARDVERLTQSKLLQYLREGRVQVLDVRPIEEYRTAHLKDAVSIPVAELHQRLDELDDQQMVVAYCRGPYCVMASDAVHLLRHRGFDAHDAAMGIDQFRVLGLPIEQAANASAQ